MGWGLNLIENFNTLDLVTQTSPYLDPFSDTTFMILGFTRLRELIRRPNRGNTTANIDRNAGLTGGPETDNDIQPSLLRRVLNRLTPRVNLNNNPQAHGQATVTTDGVTAPLSAQPRAVESTGVGPSIIPRSAESSRSQSPVETPGAGPSFSPDPETGAVVRKEKVAVETPGAGPSSRPALDQIVESSNDLPSPNPSPHSSRPKFFF